MKKLSLSNKRTTGPAKYKDQSDFLCLGVGVWTRWEPDFKHAAEGPKGAFRFYIASEKEAGKKIPVSLKYLTRGQSAKFFARLKGFRND